MSFPIDYRSTEIYNMIVHGIMPGTKYKILRLYYAMVGNALNYSKLLVNTIRDIDYDEMCCMIHGIYMDAQFAYWCRDVVKSYRYHNEAVDRAINSKLITLDDTSMLESSTIRCIWYPNPPSEATCEYLYNVRPEYKYHIAHACVEGNYIDLFRAINDNIEPDINILSTSIIKGRTEIETCIRHKARACGFISDHYTVIKGYNVLAHSKQIYYDDADYGVIEHHYYIDECINSFNTISDDMMIYDDDISTDDYYCDPLGTMSMSMSKLQSKLSTYRHNMNIESE